MSSKGPIILFPIFSALVCIILSLILNSNSPQCINTEYKDVEVLVVDEYYKPSYVQMIHTGKTIVPITHSASYEITVSYEGKNYYLHDHLIYDQYKEKVGQTVIGVLEIKEFDNNSVKYNIISLKEKEDTNYELDK